MKWAPRLQHGRSVSLVNQVTRDEYDFYIYIYAHKYVAFVGVATWGKVHIHSCAAPGPGSAVWGFACYYFIACMTMGLQKTVTLLRVLGKAQTRNVQEQNFIRLKPPFMPS